MTDAPDLMHDLSRQRSKVEGVARALAYNRLLANAMTFSDSGVMPITQTQCYDQIPELVERTWPDYIEAAILHLQHSSRPESLTWFDPTKRPPTDGELQ